MDQQFAIDSFFDDIDFENNVIIERAAHEIFFRRVQSMYPLRQTNISLYTNVLAHAARKNFNVFVFGFPREGETKDVPNIVLKYYLEKSTNKNVRACLKFFYDNSISYESIAEKLNRGNLGFYGGNFFNPKGPTLIHLNFNLVPNDDGKSMHQAYARFNTIKGNNKDNFHIIGSYTGEK